MKTEYEIRVLEINFEKMVHRIESLGGVKKGEYNQKRYVYDLRPKDDGKWIRLRTNGIRTTLTYKDIQSNTIDGTKEVEIEVDDFERTNEFLERIGFQNKGYQENKRISYVLNGVEIDIDSWPMIPTYMEIEGNSEDDGMNMVRLLEIDENKMTALNCEDIYNEIYGINLSDIKVLKF